MVKCVMKIKIIKIIRYIRIYGILRTVIKTFGRLRPSINVSLFFKLFPFKKGKATVGIIGAGQHAYSSIAFFLSILTKAEIVFVTDINPKASASMAKVYSATNMDAKYFPNKKNIPLPDIIYIASNHSTHTEYAIEYLEFGCDVFVEKPISINFNQLMNLSNKVKKTSGRIYTGYNRPYSQAIETIRKYIDCKMPISFSCSIIGHHIPDDHWYRNEKEGSRVVGNMGHWIDLAVHLLISRGTFPSFIDICYVVSDNEKPSDNVSLTMTSSNNDLLNIFFTSRSEPFEGVNESIILQQDAFIAKINDFRSMEIWKDDYYKKFRYWPKDNGHSNCVIQPFKEKILRTWSEIELSALLILNIENMVLEGVQSRRVEFK